MDFKEKILKIMSLVMEISPPDEKYNGEKKPVAFFNYSGHCPVVSLEVFETGWESYASPTRSFDIFHISDERFTEETNKRFDEIIKYLEKIIKELKNEFV